MPCLILEADAGHSELRVFLAGTPRAGDWRGTGDVRALTLPDGTVTGVAIRRYHKHADNRQVLVDLIARTLGAHRDEVVDVVARLTF